MLKKLGGPQMLSVLTIGSLALVLLVMFWEFRSSACTQATKFIQRDPSGLEFRVTDVSCDTFGSDASENIFARDAGKGGQELLLVKFGPDERSAPPRIAVTDHRIIRISIDSVSDVIQQETKYGSYTVQYDIKHVEYPGLPRNADHSTSN